MPFGLAPPNGFLSPVSRGGDVLVAFTLSIGVAVATGTERDSQALIQAADAALYEAKESGRNRVVASAAA